MVPIPGPCWEGGLPQEAWHLPLGSRAINSHVPIHSIAYNRPVSPGIGFQYRNASFIWALLELTQTSQITETYPIKSQKQFLKKLIIFSRHFSKMHYTLSFLLKQRLLIIISWSCNLCLHLPSSCSDSFFNVRRWAFSSLAARGSGAIGPAAYLLQGFFSVHCCQLWGDFRPTSSAGYVFENSLGGPQQYPEEAGAGLSRGRAL